MKFFIETKAILNCRKYRFLSSRCLIGKIGQGKFNYHTHRRWYRHVTPPLQLITIHSLLQGHLGERSTSTKEQRTRRNREVLSNDGHCYRCYVFHLLDTWRRYPVTNQSSDGLFVQTDYPFLSSGLDEGNAVS